jgi:hypothetical protein
MIDSRISASENYNGETVVIEDNKLYGDIIDARIYVDRSAASGQETHTYISRNEITSLGIVNNNVGFISIWGINDPTDYAIVNNNIIKSSGTNDPTCGIRFSPLASEHTEISFNNIQFDQSDNNVSGIYVLYGNYTKDGSEIKLNNINGGVEFVALHESYGINVINSPGIVYCSNTTDQLGYGMSFQGNCESNIAQNIFDVLGIGLNVKNFVPDPDTDPIGTPGTISVQKGTRNEWLNSGGTYQKSAQYLSTMAPQFSNYFIASDDFSDPTYNPGNLEPTSGWFSQGPNEYDLCLAQPIITAYDSIVILNETEYSALADGAKFYWKKQLLYKLLSDEDYTSYYSTYLSSVDDDSEYDIALAEIEMKKAMQMDLTDQSDLDDIHSSMMILFDSIQLYDDYNYANIDSVTYTEGLYLDSIQSKLELIWELVEEQDIIKANRMAILESDLLNVSDDLDLIVPRGTYDENYISIYTLRIEEILNGTLDPTDYELLNEIAHDYDDLSFANVAAMLYFDLCGEHPYPDYAYVCEEEVPRAELLVDNSKVNQIDIVVSNDLSKDVVVKVESTFYGNIDIFDISGRCIFRGALGNGENEVTLGPNIVPGIYYYRIQSIENSSMYKTGLIPIFE